MYDVLLQKFIRQNKALTRAEAKIERLQEQVDLLNKYMDKVIHAQANGLDSVTDRLSILEDRIFPSMGPMLECIQKVVGRFSTWTLNKTRSTDAKRRPNFRC